MPVAVYPDDSTVVHAAAALRGLLPGRPWQWEPFPKLRDGMKLKTRERGIAASEQRPLGAMSDRFSGRLFGHFQTQTGRIRPGAVRR